MELYDIFINTTSVPEVISVLLHRWTFIYLSFFLTRFFRVVLILIRAMRIKPSIIEVTISPVKKATIPKINAYNEYIQLFIKTSLSQKCPYSTIQDADSYSRIAPDYVVCLLRHNNISKPSNQYHHR